MIGRAAAGKPGRCRGRPAMGCHRGAVKRVFIWSALVLAFAIVRSAGVSRRVRRVGQALEQAGSAEAVSDGADPHPNLLPPGEGSPFVWVEQAALGEGAVDCREAVPAALEQAPGAELVSNAADPHPGPLPSGEGICAALGATLQF